MPLPLRRGGKRQRARPKPKPEGATSTCNLSHDIVVNILSRLAVKSLLRFRCVCKPWRSLFNKPKFITLHRDRTKNEGDTLLVHSRSAATSNHLISLLNTKNPDTVPDLDHPFPPHSVFHDMGIVGSINGVVCLTSPPLSPLIMLWNPATKQYRRVRDPKIITTTTTTTDVILKVSVGFAFDSVKNDYKIVRIVCFKDELQLPTRVEVYSANADTWKEIKVDLPFYIVPCACDVVVKGVPYWVVCPGDAVGFNPNQYGLQEYYLWFDVGNAVLRKLPFPSIPANKKTCMRTVNLKDCLSLLVYSEAAHAPVCLRELLDRYSLKEEENNKCFDVWMMDESDGCSWSKKFTFGPFLGVERLVGCSENGKIFLENNAGVLIMYDPDTEEVEFLPTNGALAESFGVCCYSESLTPIKGSAGMFGKKWKVLFETENEKMYSYC